DIDMAKNIISKEAEFVEADNKYDEIEIDFMGGEPLMNFKMIKGIVEWLEEGAIKIPWICSGTTNGTLLTEELKNWLREHKESLVLCASYDGTSKMQSANRGTETRSIDLDFFHELWPNQPFHMTISKETLPTLAEGILYQCH
ncbi:MAG: 4Fe-4S cluster-binding domain-containing protein, partial [Lachnospiraceae bacterium]|nr:4Fe-4S cluster-binding domain-containing protein [Lachnospiraceae bacterium]